VQRSSARTRRLVGGALCLDFANSVEWDSAGDARPSHTDALAAPADLEVWGIRLGLVEPAAAPVVHGRELRAARSLRRALHDLFAAVATEQEPNHDALARLERVYAQAISAARLAVVDGDWRLEWEQDDPRRIRFAAAVDAVDLLRADERLARLRICPGNNCGWLFLDTSGRRHWCSMEVCGSRAKMRRLYERQRQARDRSSGARRLRNPPGSAAS
jgi:predicted RNA-binding Zn ribbon-like protein